MKKIGRYRTYTFLASKRPGKLSELGDKLKHLHATATAKHIFEHTWTALLNVELNSSTCMRSTRPRKGFGVEHRAAESMN